MQVPERLGRTVHVAAPMSGASSGVGRRRPIRMRKAIYTIIYGPPVSRKRAFLSGRGHDSRRISRPPSLLLWNTGCGRRTACWRNSRPGLASTCVAGGIVNITKLETLCLSRFHEPELQWVTARGRTVKADCVIVVVHTDEGLTGIGEASAYGGPLMVRDWVDWLAPGLVGKDPTDAAIVPHPNGTNRSYDAAVGG
ncbi:MAG: hypothetical protein FJZ90_14235, partial [Chloroflexi bacterium]|nr:hypothetical protein [Chloroflexota bacterium]